jgi:Leucine-rich repeat (LRR) protein
MGYRYHIVTALASLLFLMSVLLGNVSFVLTQECVALEELYLSHNGIQRMEGLSTLQNLRVLDVSSNKLTSVEDIETLTR